VRTRQIVCALALFTVVAACGSNAHSSVSVSVPTSSPATSGGESRAQREARETQLIAFVRTLRSRLGDDFVGTSGVTDDAGVLTGLDVILLDSDSSRRRVDEVRGLFTATVPTISPDVLHFVFSPVSEKALLAAYEIFNGALANRGLDLASFSSMTVDRASGSLVVVLDGGQPEQAARDSGEIKAWAKEVAPISVQVTIDANPGTNRLDSST
jgi:hypothetical protein